MKTSIFRHILAYAAVSVIPGMASAQNLMESVTVEGRYTPEIIQADRLTLLPAAIQLKAPESPMAYDRNGVVAAFRPDALSMPATGWRATKAYDMSRGYVDLWLGSWLNSSLSAGYAAINDDDTRLNVWLQHNSTSLWRPSKEFTDMFSMPPRDKRFRYDETIGGDVRHRMPGIGTLTAAMQYHLGYFNYYGTICGHRDGDPVKAPTQTLNDVYARVGWNGEDCGRMTYSADADVRHFGYRSMYEYDFMSYYEGRYPRMRGERETILNIGGNISYSLSDADGNGSAIGIGLKYSGVLNAIGNNVNRVEATPAYVLTGRNYSARLGLNLAVVGNGEKPRLRVAPDISLAARKGLAAFMASVGGGTHLRTLAWMHEMDYYSNPGIGCYEAAYSPLDIKLAVQLNPGGRWTLGFEGVWNTTLDETFGGLYQAMLNGNPDSYGSYPESGRIHGYSLSLNGAYEFSRYLAVKGKGSWQPQDGSKGVLNGFDRPKFTADLSVVSRPTDKLSVSIDYHMRAKRQLGLLRTDLLGLSADYRLTDKISVGAELNNILNQYVELMPALPAEGFNAMGGVQVVF